MNDRFRIAGYLLVAIILGSMREFLFVNLNYQIDHVRRSTPFSFAHSKFQALVEGWTLQDLLITKWALAGFLVIIVMVLTLQVARIVFRGPRYDRFVLIGYGTASLVSLLLFIASSWLPALRLAAVQLLHSLQFPIIMIMIILSAGLVRPNRSVG